MDAQKNYIRQLLSSSILVSAEQKKSLLAQLDTFSAEKLNDVERLLTEAKGKQKYFLEKALEANPELLNEVKRFAHQEVTKVRQAKEAEDRTEDQKILNELDTELESLFND